MSQENVEIVRRGFEAFQRGGPEGLLDLFTDDVVTYRADPDKSTFDGKAGFRAATADWTEDFSEWHVLPQEFTDLGERVLVRVLQIAQGRSSGVRVEEDYWFLFELTDSRVSKLSFYSRPAEALKAAGLGGSPLLSHEFRLMQRHRWRLRKLRSIPRACRGPDR
jgi:ketosteroid isomerase-like protein